jgi:hypothetical protein
MMLSPHYCRVSMSIKKTTTNKQTAAAKNLNSLLTTNIYKFPNLVCNYLLFNNDLELKYYTSLDHMF